MTNEVKENGTNLWRQPSDDYNSYDDDDDDDTVCVQLLNVQRMAWIVNDHFSGSGRAISQSDMCVCLWTTYEINDLWPAYLACRSPWPHIGEVQSSKFTVHGRSEIWCMSSGLCWWHTRLSALLLWWYSCSCNPTRMLHYTDIGQ